MAPSGAFGIVWHLRERGIVRRSRKPLIIASRRSRLARAQAERVGRALGRLHPQIEIEYRWIESEADREPALVLADRGGKGLFTRGIEQVLLRGEADLAVHSLKDLPSEPTPGLAIAAVPRRADVRDCLIGTSGATSPDALVSGAVVGTSSPRRAAQLRRLRPDFQPVALRGNVDTRLRHVLEPSDQRRYDAVLLAAAGLMRLGRDDLLTAPLPVEQMLPAAGQGALALQCRADDHVTLTRCLPLNDPATATAVHAERQVVAGLGADCHSPIAVLAEPAAIDAHAVKRNADAHWFRLRVRVLSLDGRECLEVDQQVKTKDLRRLVKQTIRELSDRGARRLLAARHSIPTTALRPPARPAHVAG